jgi:hypothetical protein
LSESKRWAQAWNDAANNWGMVDDEAKLHAYIRHTLWNDGKNPGCKDSCYAFSVGACASTTLLLGAACNLVTRGACSIAFASAGFTGGVAVGAAMGVCVRQLDEHLAESECDK